MGADLAQNHRIERPDPDVDTVATGLKDNQRRRRVSWQTKAVVLSVCRDTVILTVLSGWSTCMCLWMCGSLCFCSAAHTHHDDKSMMTSVPICDGPGWAQAFGTGSFAHGVDTIASYLEDNQLDVVLI